jgi:transcriptional regulator with XRE-family HTH domain
MTTTTAETATKLSERVAEEIRVAMTRRRISGRKLAQQLGVSQSWVSYRLTGQQPIDLNDLAAIAGALKVPIIDLIPEEDRSAIAPYLSLAEQPTGNPHHPHGNRPNGHPGGPRHPGNHRTVRVQRPATTTGA